MTRARIEATLESAAALAFAPFLLGTWFVPRTLAAYLSTFRAKPTHTRSASGWVLSLGTFAPFMLAGVGWMQAARGEVFLPAAFIIPIALGLTLWPWMLRVVLHLVRATSLREAFHRSLLDTARDARGTSIATALFIAGTCVSLAIGWVVIEVFGAASGWAYPIAIVLTFGSLPVTWTPTFAWLGARMDREVEAPITLRDLGRLGWLFAPALCAVIAIATLASHAALPMHVITEGRGVQLQRGMLRDLGQRDVLRVANFEVDVTAPWSEDARGFSYVVHIRPLRGAAYDVVSPYEPTYAGLRSHSCGTDCEEVVVQGPDWAMSIQLREDGTRRDDTILHRIATRVGVLGASALAIMALVLVLIGVRLGRVAHELKRLTGGAFRHRLVGTLRAETATVRDGVLTSSNASIALLEDSVELQLPETLALFAADVALRELVRAPVVVLMNEQPTFATHRTGRIALSPSAELILGTPERIERQALDAIGPRVATHAAIGLAAVAILFVAMLA